MSATTWTFFPLTNRTGEVVAWTFLDADDAARLRGRRFYRHSAGYAASKGGYLHRELLGHDAPETDHQNGDRLDNRRRNLRPVTHSQNGHNRHRGGRGTSKFLGVSWDRRSERWRATIVVNRRQRYLGHFTEEHEAAAVVEAARERLVRG